MVRWGGGLLLVYRWIGWFWASTNIVVDKTAFRNLLETISRRMDLRDHPWGRPTLGGAALKLLLLSRLCSGPLSSLYLCCVGLSQFFFTCGTFHLSSISSMGFFVYLMLISMLSHLSDPEIT